MTEGPDSPGEERPRDEAGDDAEDEAATEARAAAERRRRRARVFGEVLPEGTTDDRDEGSAGPAGAGSDDWWRRQVPPHHG